MSVQFQSKVYKKQAEADYVSKDIFLKQVVDADVLRVGPKHFADSALSALEYFGLLMPVAKITVPYGVSHGHCVSRPGDNVTSPQSWAVWSQNGKKWMLRVCVPIEDSVPQYRQSVSGKILFQEDVDFWRAFRGLYPSRREYWEAERSKDFKEYVKNPFDMPLFLIRHANEDLDGLVIVPMYKVTDVHRCLKLLAFLNITLPIEYSVLALEESQKRTKKHSKRKRRKINASIKLMQTLWESVIRGLDSDLEQRGQFFPSPPEININHHFYRDHYITFYVDSLHKQEMRITEACGEVAKILAEFEPSGEEPMDAVSIYKNIYNPIIKQYRPSK